MSVVKKNRVIPKLRFKEFNDEWKIMKLGELFKISAGGDISKEYVSKIKTKEFKYPIFANAAKDKGLYGYSNTYRVEANVITVAGRGNLGIAHSRKEKFYPIVRLLVLKPKEDCNVDYFENRINRMKIFNESTGVPQLTAPQLSSYNISYPSIFEQNKLAEFLSSVDKKIQLLEKKKEQLELYKKGVMQKIFSREIRFKDENGNSFPNWEKIKLGEGIEQKSIRNKDNSVELVLSISNKKGFLSQQDQFDGYQVASKNVTNYKLVSKGEYAYNPSRINVGSMARLDDFERGIVSPMYVIFKLRNNLNPIFFDALYSSHRFKYLIKIGCSGSVRDSLNFNEMEKFDIELPSIEEQKKIADFLSFIDKKINTTSAQIDKTKEFKKGLLQQMFV